MYTCVRERQRERETEREWDRIGKGKTVDFLICVHQFYAETSKSALSVLTPLQSLPPISVTPWERYSR
jgi:hypothetical protein